MATTTPTQPANSGIDQLLGILQKQQQNNPAADLGSILGAASSGERANRMSAGDFYLDHDKMMLDRENRQNTLGLQAQADRNLNETDALKKMQQTSYITGGGSNFGPQSIQLNGSTRQLPSFAGIAPMAPSAADKAGAASLQGQLQARLSPGGSFQPSWNYQPKDVESYAKAGLLEKLLSYGGAGTSALGSIFGNPSNATDVGSWLKKLFGGGGPLPSSSPPSTYNMPTMPINQNASQGVYPFVTENPGLYNNNNALTPSVTTDQSWSLPDPGQNWLGYPGDWIPGAENAPSIQELLGQPPMASAPNYNDLNNWG